MEILIISFDADPPYMGGVATMTSILAKGFSALGHTCSLGYLGQSKWPSAYFQDKIWLSKDNLPAIQEYGSHHSFGLIISQFVLSDFDILSSLRGPNTRLLVVHHNRPYIHGLQKDTLYKLLEQSPSLRRRLYNLAKIVVFPLLHYLSTIKEKRAFRISYRQCDRFVLLSEHYFPLFRKILLFADKERMAFIGNPATFDEILPISDLASKKKQVLAVVSVSTQKNVMELFRIWSAIEECRELDDWNFVFVGDGDGFDTVREKVASMNMKRIRFTGFTDPLPYYRESAITMMTSHYEGWPMTLLESQQMGVVPIVYDSFESLPDIVTDQKTGIVVPYGDRDGFIRQLESLMRDPERLEGMMRNCLQVSHGRTKEACVKAYLSAAGF